MQKYQDLAVNAVHHDQQVVAYMNSAVYTTAEGMPDYYHIEAVGSQGLYIDVCISNERSARVYAGVYCDWKRMGGEEG